MKTTGFNINDLPALDYDPQRFNCMANSICSSVVTHIPGSTSLNWSAGGTGRKDWWWHYWRRTM